MLFLVELDHVKSGALLTPEAGRDFIEQIIFTTLARAEQLVAEEDFGWRPCGWPRCAAIHCGGGFT
jgi:hypothetical protein